MENNSSTTILIVVFIVFIVCCSSSSSLVVAANESPSFGGSALDFLRGEWYTNIFGGGGSGGGGGGGDEGGDESGGGGGGSGGSGDDGEDDNDKKGDKDKNYKNNCAYLYKDKDGKKYLISKCTDGEKTYKGSKLDGMSSIRVGKDLTVYVYDKNDKKKTYKGKKDKVYNLSGNWDNDTKKMVLRHKDVKNDDKNDDKNDGKNPETTDSKYKGPKDHVEMYTGPYYKGKIATFKPGSYHSVEGVQIKSMRIPIGWEVQAWHKPYFDGYNTVFRGDVRIVTDETGQFWPDISSFKIVKRGY